MTIGTIWLFLEIGAEVLFDGCPILRDLLQFGSRLGALVFLRTPKLCEIQL